MSARFPNRTWLRDDARLGNRTGWADHAGCLYGAGCSSTVKGEKKQEREEKGENWTRTERSYGSFERAIPLPQGTDTEQAEAAFEKGVLTITLAKTNEGAPAKIAVKAK